MKKTFYKEIAHEMADLICSEEIESMLIIGARRTGKSEIIKEIGKIFLKNGEFQNILILKPYVLSIKEFIQRFDDNNLQINYSFNTVTNLGNKISIEACNSLNGFTLHGRTHDLIMIDEFNMITDSQMYFLKNYIGMLKPKLIITGTYSGENIQDSITFDFTCKLYS